MKKEKTNRLTLFLTVILGCWTFCGCNDDYEGLEYAITGEWFLDESDAYQTNRTIKEFTSDGKYIGLKMIVGELNNIIVEADGTYSHNDNNINTVFTVPYDNRHWSENYIVVRCDKYSLSLHEDDLGKSNVYHRIVDTYTMQLGETRQCIINDPAFNATGYVSYDENIATVSADGLINATKRGITFIKVMSGEGAAIIRVKVNDADNIMDDYTKYIYAPIDQVFKDFGESYTMEASSGLTMVGYYLTDDIVKEIIFAHLQREHVYRITGSFRHSVDLKPIIASFDQKYEKRPSTGDLYHYYHTYIDGRLVKMLINEEFYSFIYEVTPNAIEEYDGVITLTADNLAKWFDFDLEDSDGYFISLIENELYRGFTMLYDNDTREISAIQLICRPSVEESDLREWFEDHYYVRELSQTTFYYPHPAFARSEYYVSINKNPVTGSLIVSYLK